MGCNKLSKCSSCSLLLRLLVVKHIFCFRPNKNRKKRLNLCPVILACVCRQQAFLKILMKTETSPHFWISFHFAIIKSENPSFQIHKFAFQHTLSSAQQTYTVTGLLVALTGQHVECYTKHLKFIWSAALWYFVCHFTWFSTVMVNQEIY